MSQSATESDLVNGSVAVTSAAARLVAQVTNGAPRSPFGVYVSVASGGNTVFVGGSAVSTANGTPVAAGTGLTINVDDPSKIWVIAASTGTIKYLYAGAP